MSNSVQTEFNIVRQKAKQLAEAHEFDASDLLARIDDCESYCLTSIAAFDPLGHDDLGYKVGWHDYPDEGPEPPAKPHIEPEDAGELEMPVNRGGRPRKTPELVTA